MSKVSKFGHPYHCEFYLFYIWKKTKWAMWALSKIISAQCSPCSPFFYVMYKIYKLRFRWAKWANLGILAHLWILPYFLYRIKKTPFQMSKVSKLEQNIFYAHVCSPFYLFYIWILKTKWFAQGWALSKIFSAQCSRLLTLFLP